jgi:hypothetical protein
MEEKLFFLWQCKSVKIRSNFHIKSWAKSEFLLGELMGFSGFVCYRQFINQQQFAELR